MEAELSKRAPRGHEFYGNQHVSIGSIPAKKKRTKNRIRNAIALSLSRKVHNKNFLTAVSYISPTLDYLKHSGIIKGEAAGHPFRGNQYTKGIVGSAMAPKSPRVLTLAIEDFSGGKDIEPLLDRIGRSNILRVTPTTRVDDSRFGNGRVITGYKIDFNSDEIRDTHVHGMATNIGWIGHVEEPSPSPKSPTSRGLVGEMARTFLQDGDPRLPKNYGWDKGVTYTLTLGKAFMSDHMSRLEEEYNNPELYPEGKPNKNDQMAGMSEAPTMEILRETKSRMTIRFNVAGLKMLEEDTQYYGWELADWDDESIAPAARRVHRAISSAVPDGTSPSTPKVENNLFTAISSEERDQMILSAYGMVGTNGNWKTEVESNGGLMNGVVRDTRSNEVLGAFTRRLDAHFAEDGTKSFSVYHSSFFMDHDSGKGIGGEFVTRSMQSAADLGVSRFTTHAINGARTNGVITWSKLGFKLIPGTFFIFSSSLPENEMARIIQEVNLRHPEVKYAKDITAEMVAESEHLFRGVGMDGNMEMWAKDLPKKTRVAKADGSPMDIEEWYEILDTWIEPTEEEENLSGVSKGEGPGHPFRGNQWTKGIPGSSIPQRGYVKAKFSGIQQALSLIIDGGYKGAVDRERPDLPDDTQYQYERNTSHGNQMRFGHNIATEQGFDGLPEIVSEERMKEELAKGGSIIWSGGGSLSTRTEYENGTLFVTPGVSGAGRYFSTHPMVAEHYVNAKEQGYPQWENSKDPKGDRIMSGVLRADARVIELGELIKKTHELQKALLSKPAFRNMIVPSRGPDGRLANRSPHNWLSAYLNDPGNVAAILGYDAIVRDAKAIDGYNSLHVIVLNRTAVLISPHETWKDFDPPWSGGGEYLKEYKGPPPGSGITHLFPWDFSKGESAGHPFRGNQYEKVGGSGARTAGRDRLKRNNLAQYTYEEMTHRSSHGITIKTGSGFEPAAGVMVSLVGHEEMISSDGEFNAAAVQGYLNRHKAELAKRGNYLGGWIQQDTKQVFLDISRKYGTLEEGIKKGVAADQWAIAVLHGDPSLTEFIDLKSDDGPVEHQEAIDRVLAGGSFSKSDNPRITRLFLNHNDTSENIAKEIKRLAGW